MTDTRRFLDEGAPDRERHDGGSGHSASSAWGAADGGLAVAFAAALPASARQVLDHLVERPGQRVHCTELFARAFARTDGAGPASAVADVIGGMREAYDASGRRYPFSWWEADGGRTGADYAVKPSVAALFLTARYPATREPAPAPTGRACV
ncbi:DUF6416 domain-containing protein [Streptomyces sp. NPDC058664]|uniref:DUF6416 domain-containing protein n=1 Tax=unclassified Streptomyces TaxID=2593676 RepID=UPI003647278D